jgi:hypothetical protein
MTVLLLRRSILTEKVARHRHHLIREYSVDPLEVVRVGGIMDRAVPTLPATMTVTELSEEIAHGDSPLTHRQGTPVVDKEEGYAWLYWAFGGFNSPAVAISRRTGARARLVCAPPHSSEISDQPT